MNDIFTENGLKCLEFFMKKIAEGRVSVSIMVHPDKTVGIDIYPYLGGFVKVDDPAEDCRECKIDIPAGDLEEAHICENCSFEDGGDCLLGGFPETWNVLKTECEHFRTKQTCLTCVHHSQDNLKRENCELMVLCNLDDEFHYNAKPCRYYERLMDMRYRHDE